MDNNILIKEYVKRISLFYIDAHNILSLHESSQSRIIILDKVYDKLGLLSIRQDEMIRQSLRCVENKLYAAAHVMAWAAIMDHIEEKIEKKGLNKLLKIRNKWKLNTIEDLRENYPEHQILDAGKDLKLYTKSISKALKGLLNKRNECAHPSDYYPDLNQTLGYISEIISRIEMISKAK